MTVTGFFLGAWATESEILPRRKKENSVFAVCAKTESVCWTDLFVQHTDTRTHLQIEWFVSRQFIFQKKGVHSWQWKVFIHGIEMRSSVAVKSAWNVVTLHGHAHAAGTSWVLYSMPDEHFSMPITCIHTQYSRLWWKGVRVIDSCQNISKCKTQFNSYK